MADSVETRAVLIVEDEPLQRMMLVDLVETAGYDAVEALGPDDAVSILEDRLDIQIVIADIDMPGGVDGLKLAAAIRDRWPPIELIITSGRRNPKVADIPARAVFMSKPYLREQVVATMQKFSLSIK